MKKIILIIIIVLTLISCEEKKTEFIQSRVRSNLFLIKNPPHMDSLLKKEIILFLIKNPHTKKDAWKFFYKYTSDTEYFLDNDDYDGFGAQVLSMYENLSIAYFTFDKCKNDTSKVVGKFHFYGNDNDLSELDTIIYKCN